MKKINVINTIIEIEYILKKFLVKNNKPILNNVIKINAFLSPDK